MVNSVASQNNSRSTISRANDQDKLRKSAPEAVPTPVAIRILLAWTLRCNLDVWIGVPQNRMLYGPHKELKYDQERLAKILIQRGWRRLKTETQLWQHSEYKTLLLANANEILLAAPEDKVEIIKKEIGQKLEIKWETSCERIGLTILASTGEGGPMLQTILMLNVESDLAMWMSC